MTPGMMDAGGIKATLTVDGLRKFTGDMDAAGNAMDRTGKRGIDAMAKIDRAAKVGFLAAGVAAVMSVKSFANFDDAMNRVRINSGASSKELGLLGKAARDMGKKFPASATEAAEAMNELLKAGMSVQDVLGGGLENAMAVATAEGMDMAAAAKVMANAMNVFGVSGADAAQVAAALSNVASATSADVNDLALSLGQVGGTANRLGLSVGETTAALGVLMQKGLDGSKAGTAFNSMLLQMSAPTGPLKDKMKALGLTIYDAQGKVKPFTRIMGDLRGVLDKMSAEDRSKFLRMMGVDAQQAADYLAGSKKQLADLTGESQKFDAPIQKAREQMKSFGKQLDTTGESITNAGMRIGAALAPALASVLPSVQSAAAALGSLDAGTLQAGAAFIALTAGLTFAIPVIVAGATALRGFAAAVAIQAAVNSVTMGVGALSASMAVAQVGVRALTVAMMANPLFMAAGAAAAIVGVAVAISQLGDSGAASVDSLNRQRAAAEGARTAYDSIKTAVNGVVTAQLALSGSALGVERAQISQQQASARVKELYDAGKKGTLEYKSALLAEKQAHHDVKVAKQQNADASTNAANAQKVLTDGAKKAAKDIADSKKAYKEAGDELRRIEKSSGVGKLVGDSFKQMIPGADTSREKVHALKKAMDDSADAMKKAEADAANIKAELGLLGGETGSATADIAKLNAELDSLPDSKTVNVTVNVKKKGDGKATGGIIDGFADGGRVRGAGTGTSDSIPAMLSAGEWVLTAKQARGIGYGRLAALPKFARGGMVARPSGALTGSIRQASIDANPTAKVKQATQLYNAALAAQRGKTGDKLRDARALTKQRADELVQARQALAAAKAAAAADRTAKASASRSDRVSAVGGVGTDLWKSSAAAGTTESLSDDLAVLRQRLAELQKIGGRESNQAIKDTLGEIWTMENITAPAQAAAETARKAAEAVQAVGAKGSDLWKQSSLAAVTESLDDDMAALQARLAQLQALGGDAAAGAITDTLADIWTMQNITAPAQAAAMQNQKDQWAADAAAAMGRGFYGASGGAGGGGNVGTTESTGGGASGVGHQPRPEIDRIWLDGVQLNDLDARENVGVEITELLGWDEAEDFESVRSKRADGDALGGNRDGSVQVVIRGRLRGSTYADYHARRRALKAKVRAASAEVLLKVPDVTYGASAGDYASVYAESGMVGYERRRVKLVSNVRWTDAFGTFGSGFEFTVRSPQRFVVSDIAAIAPASDNAAAMATAAGGALTSILSIRGEVAASPALDTSKKFLGIDQSSRIAVRAGSGDDAFDTFTKLPDPAVLPPATTYGSSFDPTSTYLAVGSGSSPYVTIYKRSGDTFTKLTDPAALPTGFSAPSFDQATGTYLAVAHDSSPYVTIYKRSGDTFTKLTDPAALPTGVGRGASFDPTSTYLVIAHNSSPYVTIYKRSGDTFTKLPDPAALPASNGYGCSFDPTSTYLVIAHNSSPYVTIYKRSGDTFTKLPDPAALPTGNARGVCFDPTSTYMSVAHTSSPYVTIYKRSGDTFSKMTNPAALPTGIGYGCAFDPAGVYLAVAHDSSPYVTIYKRSGDTFTKLTDPAALPVFTGSSIAFDPNGAYMMASSAASPYIAIYSVAGAGSSLEYALGVLTITPPSAAIAAGGANLPVASADFSASGNLSARDSFLIDTATQSATPLLRTPLARLLGGGSMLHAMIPTRSAKNDYTLLSAIGSTPRVADAIAAIGAVAWSSTGAINEAVGGALNYPGLMPLASTDNTVTTALAGWRAKVAGADFSQNGYVHRRLDATLGEPTARPVMHVALVAPPAVYATTATALLAATGVDFAALLSIESTHSAVVRNTSVGLYHDAARMVPGVIHSRTATGRIARFSGAVATTPDPALHVWAVVIVDAGEIHHTAIALLDVNTGAPVMWFAQSESVFGTASTAAVDASQATTASGSPTMTDAYVSGSQRSVGIGGTVATIQNTGIATSAAGHSGIVTLDALTELAPYGVTLAGSSNGLQSRTALASIARVVREWIGDRFAPQTIEGSPIALGVEWTDREPDLHGEPYVRLDSIIAEQYEQDLGKSRTGGVSTEHMSVSGIRGVGATPIEARSVR